MKSTDLITKQWDPVKIFRLYHLSSSSLFIVLPPSASTRLYPLCLAPNLARPHLSPHLAIPCFQSCKLPAEISFVIPQIMLMGNIPFHYYLSERWLFHLDSRRPLQAPLSLLSVHTVLLQLRHLLRTMNKLVINCETKGETLPGGVQR